MFTSGKKCKQKLKGTHASTEEFEDNLGYLVEIFTLEKLVPEPSEGDQKNFEQKAYGSSIAVNPPSLIDRIVRPHENTNISIGQVRQAQWQMSPEAAALLRNQLCRERLNLAEKLFGKK
jgi:hypothetical protein